MVKNPWIFGIKVWGWLHISSGPKGEFMSIATSQCW